MLEGLNFKEFIALLSAFSARATKDDKLKCESLTQHEEEFALIFRLHQSNSRSSPTNNTELQCSSFLHGFRAFMLNYIGSRIGVMHALLSNPKSIAKVVCGMVWKVQADADCGCE